MFELFEYVTIHLNSKFQLRTLAVQLSQCAACGSSSAWKIGLQLGGLGATSILQQLKQLEFSPIHHCWIFPNLSGWKNGRGFLLCGNIWQMCLWGKVIWKNGIFSVWKHQEPGEDCGRSVAASPLSLRTAVKLQHRLAAQNSTLITTSYQVHVLQPKMLSFFCLYPEIRVQVVH